jgi:peptidyl-prolyl cis-trans isomerase A (cyclophilin A)
MRRLLTVFAIALTTACSGSKQGASNALLSPDSAKVAAVGPDSFLIHFTTSRGDIDVKVHRAWAPRGADRLYYLASSGFYDSVRFFRVLDGFLAQFGVHGDPAVNKAWRERTIPDDPVKHTNARGTLSFANDGPNTRNTQLFVNLKSNAFLDKDGYAAVAEVVSGMAVADSLYVGYGDGPPDGIGPIQGRIATQGTPYLNKFFPSLDFIKTARVTAQWPSAGAPNSSAPRP